MKISNILFLLSISLNFMSCDRDDNKDIEKTPEQKQTEEVIKIFDQIKNDADPESPEYKRDFGGTINRFFEKTPDLHEKLTNNEDIKNKYILIFDANFTSGLLDKRIDNYVSALVSGIVNDFFTDGKLKDEAANFTGLKDIKISDLYDNLTTQEKILEVSSGFCVSLCSKIETSYMAEVLGDLQKGKTRNDYFMKHNIPKSTSNKTQAKCKELLKTK